MPDDATLLCDYLAGSQAAFAELVHRHMNLVYAAARRQVRDPHLAEDVAQAVFIILSRRAGGLRASPTIAGWLIKTTRYVASNALRAQQRRQKHEQVAAMLATQLDTESRSSEITSILDDALSKLRPNDRSAISMRYLQNRSVEEISSELRISPPAAAKRIERALDRLRSHLTRRGVVASVVAITAALSAESSIAAPPALTSTAAASTFSPAAATLAKGTLTAMLRTKVLAAAATAHILATGARRHHASSQSRTAHSGCRSRSAPGRRCISRRRRRRTTHCHRPGRRQPTQRRRLALQVRSPRRLQNGPRRNRASRRPTRRSASNPSSIIRR